MKLDKNHEGVCGIYCIRNTINNKVYVGKSLNVRQRVYNHIGGLNAKDKKRENQHFINSWWKHGRDNFEYFILEVIDKTVENFETFIKERELFWMDTYKSNQREFGYNLRRDSATNMICHEETRKKMSKSHIKRFEDPNERLKISEFSKEFWKNNPEIKEQMKEKVSNKHTRYRIYQYSKDGSILIKVWEKLKNIIVENPSYKVHNIYACCSGEKPSMYGYRWVKVLIDDIVQPCENVTEGSIIPKS